jgi:HAD superfamily hydrolase (TIGR01549 family)
MMAVVSVIFDLEGTLVRTAEMTKELVHDFRRQTRKKLIELGVPEEILDGAEPTSALMRNKAMQYADASLSNSEKVRLVQELNRFLLGHELKWAENSAVFPDTMPVLRTLRNRGISMAIVTNTSRQAAQNILAKHALPEYFKVVITRDSVAKVKPDPQGTLLAIEQLQERNAFFVGDMPIDTEAAGRAGIKSILIKRSWPPGLFSFTFPADYTIESLSEIPGILEENHSL